MKKIFCSIIMIFTLILTSSNILLAQDTSNDESIPYNQEDCQKIAWFLGSEWKFSFYIHSHMAPEYPRVAIFENGEEGIWNGEAPLGFVDAIIDKWQSDIPGYYQYTVSILTNNYNYDIDNPQTWEGIEWEVVEENGVKTKRISKIGNSFDGLNPYKLFLVDENDYFNAFGLGNSVEYEASSLYYGNFPYLKYLDRSGILDDTLEVSGCTNLEQLNCSNSSINTLDISNCPNLKSIDCSKTNLSKLDLSSCNNLEVLNCSNTKMNTLDLSSNSNLKVLDCSNTKMNTLDLSNCNNLEELNCSNTSINISTLDLSNNSNLKSLECSNCNLNLKELIEINSKLPNILTEGSFNQNILNETSYMKGDIKEFGNGESTTYEWYFEGTNTPSTLSIFNGSKYDFTDYQDYIGKKIYCKISNRGVTLNSNLTTITSSTSSVNLKVSIVEAPTSIVKGDEPVKQQLKANVILSPSYAYIDKSVQWKISGNRSYDTKIDENGMLTISPNETSQKIEVKAISNFDSYEYDTETIIIKSVLPAPTGLGWNDKTAYWNPVNLASGYELQIFKKGLEEPLDTISLKSNITRRSLEEYFTSYGNYIFKIKAVGDEEYYEDSAYSESEVKEFTNLESLQESIDRANKILEQGNPNIDELIGSIADLSDEIITYNN